MSNFDTFLTRLRWDSTYENFTDLTSFRTDSIVYEFKTPLSKEDQNAFIEFLGDSKHLKTIMPDEFCNFFLNHRIEFEIKFQYDFNLLFKQNYRYLKTIRILRKSLKRMEPNRWHTIYAVNQNYPTKDCYCYVQTEEDYKNRLMSLAFFHVKEHCFVPLVPSEEDMMDDIKYWRMYDNPKPLIYCSSKPFSDEVSEK